jgi:hypothetical protein
MRETSSIIGEEFFKHLQSANKITIISQNDSDVNSFFVRNQNDEKFLDATFKLKQVCCDCCSAYQGFSVNIEDIHQNQVLRISADYVCCSLCCFMCLYWVPYFPSCCFKSQEIKVDAFNGHLLGIIKEQNELFGTVYEISSSDNRTIKLVENGDCFELKSNLRGNVFGETRKDTHYYSLSCKFFG